MTFDIFTVKSNSLWGWILLYILATQGVPTMSERSDDDDFDLFYGMVKFVS